MRPDTKQLYSFMTSCGGNWRNTICTYDPDHPGDGLLIAFDRDAQPVMMRAGKLCELSGEQIDLLECRLIITFAEFRDIFGRYLMWHSPTGKFDALDNLRGSGGGTS